MQGRRGGGRRAVALAWLLCWLIGLASLASAAGERVIVLEVRGPITPTVAGYLERGIDGAERDGAHLVVIQLDTPGGLDDSTRKIMQRIIASKVPVVVYVYPSGGRAASAGLFIAQAAHVAAMAPDTNIGSAHPVQLGGGQAPDKTMTEKIENDAAAIVKSIAQTRGRNHEWVERAVRQSINAPAREALELKVVDLVAADYPALLAALDGREVELQGGRKVMLSTSAFQRHDVPMTWPERIIQTISDPNIAYLLLTIGMYGLIYELSNPGTWVPGVIGAISLVLALYALGTLPTNWAGVALIVLAFVLFGAELVVTSHGGLTLAGVVAMVLGSLLLFSGGGPELAVSPVVILGVVGGTAGFFAFVVGTIWRASRRRSATGAAGMIGQVGIVSRPGQVHVAGELWRAEGESITPGDRVQVVAVNGLTLKVMKAA